MHVWQQVLFSGKGARKGQAGVVVKVNEADPSLVFVTWDADGATEECAAADLRVL